MGLKRTAAPTANLITPEEARKHLSLPPDGGGHDDHVTRLIAAAVESVEQYCGRALLTQTWRLSIDSFPACWPSGPGGGEIVVPRPPLVSVTDIKYDDADGVEQTLDASKYKVTTDAQPGRIAPAYGETWPATRSQREAVRVTYVAGYGASAASVPEPLRHAVLLMVAHWFANREPVVTGTIASDIPMSAQWLMDGYRTGVNPECYRLAE